MPAGTHRKLQEAMAAYRIGDPKGSYPIYSAEGARRASGRWHRKGQDVIYAAQHYSTAMLEKLVRYSGSLPKGQHYIRIEIPAGVSYEVVTAHSLRGWDEPSGRIARAFGAKWCDEGRSALLIVPSVVARMENNVVINVAHIDAARIKPGLEEPVTWDERLFGGGSG
jgi:RES domain-containing protein